MAERTITDRMLEAFASDLLREEKSKLTVKKYLHDVRCFAAFSSGRALKKSLVLDYKTHLEKNYAVASANSMLAALRAFWIFLGWEDLCVKPFKVQQSVFARADTELTRTDYIQLLNTAKRTGKDRLNLILQTICGTGIRVSELKFITAESVRKGEAVVSCKNKIRTVFIVRKLQKKILQYCKQKGIASGAVFITKNGNPMSRTNIWREMKKLCRESGVSPNKVFPHNLRHLFARTFYESEKDIAKLSDILGHTSINTTRLYILTTGVQHRRCMENLRLIV